MDDFKQCNNGHFYEHGLAACPYCPKVDLGGGHANNQFSETVLEKTSNYGSKTAIEEDLEKTKLMNESEPNVQAAPQFFGDLDKTYIKLDNPDAPNYKKNKAPRRNRMLVGWLVSYTIDEMGRDFRLYEGRNSIGTNPINDIVVIQDPSISGHNTTILFRGDKCFIKDEFSTNGTKLNGVEISPNEVPELEDGSILHVGNTLFKFRSAL